MTKVKWARYMRKWRRENPEKAHAISVRMRPVNRARCAFHRDVLDAIKMQPCMDCWKWYPPYVMQFDHRNPRNKKFNVGTEIAASLVVLLAEAFKCDVVCANCHAERTHGPGE